MAIRSLAKGDESRRDEQDRPPGGHGLARLVMWIAGLGAGGLVLRRIMRRRSTIDAGAVSTDWIAHHKGTPSDPFTA